MEKINRSGFLFAALGTTLFSCKGILIKFCYQYGASPDVVIALRMIFAFPFYVAVAAVYRSELAAIPVRYILAAAGFGLMGYCISSLLDMYGLLYITASLERIILYAYPTMVLIMTVVFFNAKATRAMTLCIVIIYAGLAIVFLNPAHSTNTATNAATSANIVLGSTLVFAAAFTYAIFLVATEMLIKTIPNRLFTTIAMLSASVVIFIYAGARVDAVELLNQPAIIYILALLIAFFCTVLPSFMVAAAVSHIGAAKTGAVGSAGPLVTLVLATLMLGESITPLQLVGFFIVVGGVYWLGQHRPAV